MGDVEVAAFLSHLAGDPRVAASTQNQALNALLFLYKFVFGRPLGTLHGVVHARRPERLPVVLTIDEVARLLACIDDAHWLPACLRYGSGLRLMETVRLRVKDVDFEHRAIFVRESKGGADRVITLADELIIPLKRHLQSVRLLHERDLAAGFAEVYLTRRGDVARRRPRVRVAVCSVRARQVTSHRKAAGSALEVVRPITPSACAAPARRRSRSPMSARSGSAPAAATAAAASSERAKPMTR